MLAIVVYLQLIPIPREMMQSFSSVPSWQFNLMSHLIDLGTQCSPLSHTNMEALKQLIISNPGGISREQNNCIVGNTDFPWILRTCRQKEGKKYSFLFCKKKNNDWFITRACTIAADHWIRRGPVTKPAAITGYRSVT